MTLNLGSLLAASAKRQPNDVAAILGEQDYSYEELDSRSRVFATALVESGIQPGDCVALMAPNGPYFTVAYFGALYAGATLVTFNVLLSADEIEFQLSDSKAKALIVHGMVAENAIKGFDRVTGCTELFSIAGADQASLQGAQPIEQSTTDRPHADVFQSNPDDTAVILYTSGTTGKPKGAELSHFNLLYNAQFSCERGFGNWPFELQIIGPGQMSLAALPLFHIFGQTSVQNATLFGGATLTYLSRFTPTDAVSTIERDSVTIFCGVPTMFFALLHDPAVANAKLTSLKYCISGGAAMPAEVKKAFRKRFDVGIQEGYGLTETSPLACVQRRDRAEKCGSVGAPLDGIDIKIFDEQDHEVPTGERGEIVIRGHNVMKGYFNRPEATAEAMRSGWFHSGDMGYIDEDGDVVIVDRKKEMILRGGYNVYPREVEEVLYAHPAVREAAVIGVPDDMYGEEVKAVISLAHDQSCTADEIIAYCKEHVAAYKYPRTVEILDELPKGPTGKILKRALQNKS